MATAGWDAVSSNADLDLHDPDPALNQQLHRLVDGVTKGPITADTQLVALYQYDLPKITVDNHFLKNLTGITAPLVPCQLIVESEDGTEKAFPPVVDDIKQGYYMRLAFDKLLFAPTVRLQCHFVRVIDEVARRCSILCTVAVEWHFNDYDGPGTGIANYIHNDPTATISFEAGPATSSGFSIANQKCDEMLAEAQAVVSALKSFLQPGAHEVQIKLKGSKLPDTDREELNKVRSRLPSGDGLLLPSIGSVEYQAFGDLPEKVFCGKDAMRKPFALLSGAVKAPMTSMACLNTFSTVKEAGVQLGYATAASETEAKEALKLWAETYHRGRLFAVGRFAVVGVTFRDFKKLGSINDDLHYRLPKNLSVRLIFTDIHNDRQVRAKAILIGNPAGLPAHDAYFRITSEPVEFFGKERDIQIRSQKKELFDVKVEPNFISATFTAQLDTINQLQQPKNKRWHGILLNQVHEALEEIDLTQPQAPGATISADVRAQADPWLMNWFKWNDEQLDVINGIRVAKGGVIIVMGPAGTGKTLLQQALSIYFYLLGFHVLALAPANSNVDQLAVELGKVMERKALPSQLKFLRLFASVQDVPAVEEDDEQDNEYAACKNPGFMPFYDLLTALDEEATDKGTAREHGLAQAVMAAAKNKTHTLKRRLRTDAGVAVGPLVNAWDLLREFIDLWDSGAEIRGEMLDEKYAKKLQQYRLAYKQCRAHLLGRSRYVLSTTGNARNQELLANWYAEEKEWGLKRVGVIVFVDEAAKDLETNVWSGVVCERWSEGVKGLIMFGDDKQLKPTNTCSKGAVNFNMFNSRLDIPLPCRLVQEGHFCYRLLEQRRMHSAISAFPNREIYSSKLRDGAGTNKSLDEVIPGLNQILRSLLADFSTTNNWDKQYIKEEMPEADVRLHWIEVIGDRVKHNATKSIAVHQHVDTFFKMMPRLVAFFKLKGLKLGHHLMIITAYSYSLHLYQDRINELLRRDATLTVDDMPQVLTVDASQGREATMCLFDSSCQHSDVMGFVDNVGRCNVAITRAKEVFWVLGGTMATKYRRGKGVAPVKPLLAKYKKEMDEAGQVHRFA